MASFLINLFSIVLIAVMSCANGDSTFYQLYKPLWGFNHLTVLNQGQEVQLLLDTSSGAGFRSKSDYCFGSFQMKMKISEKKSGGVVSAFYLTSSANNVGNHDEIDFEFVGTTGILQTNVFANDLGHREERIQLSFDPSAAFHTYEIVWSQYQVVFNVDSKPIRVFKTSAGINFSSKPTHVEGTIWNVSWAGPVEWSKAPFIVHYQGFNINAPQTSLNQRCFSLDSDSGPNSNSNSSIKPWELSPAQQKEYEEYRSKYLLWNYCSDKSRYHPECESK